MSDVEGIDFGTDEAFAFGAGVFAGGLAWGPLGLIIGAVIALIVIRLSPLKRAAS